MTVFPMATKQPTFETAFKKLEEILKKLEEGNLSLNDSLKLFEEGTELAHFCENSLQKATGQVEKLIADSEGNRKKISFSVDD